MKKRSVVNASVNGKKVLVRCDFNVPFLESGEIADDRRITGAIPTINLLLAQGAKVILCSHLGRPHGKKDPKLSLKKVSFCLSRHIGKLVRITGDTAGKIAKSFVDNLQNGEICLLENLRFEIGEEENDFDFARKLSSFADIYVNDAFGTCHREHASIVSVPKILPSYCGILVQREIDAMSKAVDEPERPFVSILGGAKVSDKIDLIKNLMEKVDVFIIGGGMAYTFMNALGYSVGDSICERDKLSLARDIMAEAKDKGIKFLLPVDNRIGREYKPYTESQTVDSDKIPEGWQGLDIGMRTSEMFSEEIKNAGTVIWNGPMGVSEWENFSHGTFAVARALAEGEAVSIVGGGDSAAAVAKLGFAQKMTHISTGGGASLMFFEGRELPGISALSNEKEDEDVPAFLK
ncbi:MAG: phosphoglycerate kinase [Oscillospiraceae bacterium]|jgi:phosphoglycerate kinase|nr:phosphoglycerate kinase [Oscillospiraceae bacterium]